MEKELVRKNTMKFIPLYSGSTGNSSLCISDSVKLLIDAGVSCTAIINALNKLNVQPNEINAIIISHDHVDHTRGAGVFSRKYGVPIYANEQTWEVMRPNIGQINPSLKRYFRTNEDFYIGDINVFPFNTPHDAAEPVGFNITCGGRKLFYLTDVGRFYNWMADRGENADCAYVEANHNRELVKQCRTYPYQLKLRILSDRGHMSNEDCAQLLIKLHERGLRNAILAHLSKENNTPELAYNTVTHILEANGIHDMNITVAKRSDVTGIFEV